MQTENNDDRFVVVINGESQYSIWPSRLEVPMGWRPAGYEGSRAECLSHIAQAWSDMRPLSVRRHLEASA
jgi:MbtH protein